MALSITSNYAGAAASEFIAPALLGATTFKNGYVTVWPNVKFKFNILLGDISNPVQADACDINDSGTVTLTEAVLQPEKMMVNLLMCKTTLEAHFEAEKMTAGALNSDITPNLEKFVTGYVAEIVSSFMERLTWEGKKSASTGIYATTPSLKLANGLFYRAYNASGAVQVAGTTITGSNAITEIEKVHAAIPVQVYDHPDMKIFISRADFKSYHTHLSTTFVANSNFDVTKPMQTSYKGIPLAVVGLESGHMVAAIKRNLHVGTDLLSDQNDYQLLDLQQSSGAKQVRIIMRFSLDTQVTNGSEVVVYGTPIA
jgi:hypothetical protein